ncbi:MAG: hypothetical protein K2H03_00585 [Muribaculaceae bacterium]|nr:hypothetical protein [Muribaculaceae bacterium]
MESAVNKKSLITSALVILLVATAIALLPLMTGGVEWKDSISYAGSVASIGAIVVTLAQIAGLKQSAEAIKTAIADNNRKINMILTVAEVSRHIQMVHEVRSYVKQQNWEAVHIRLSDIRLLVDKVTNGYQKYNISYSKASACLREISEDLRNLNGAIHGQGEIDGAKMANHLDGILPVLSSVNTQLQKFENE